RLRGGGAGSGRGRPRAGDDRPRDHGGPRPQGQPRSPQALQRDALGALRADGRRHPQARRLGVRPRGLLQPDGERPSARRPPPRRRARAGARGRVRQARRLLLRHHRERPAPPRLPPERRRDRRHPGRRARGRRPPRRHLRLLQSLRGNDQQGDRAEGDPGGRPERAPAPGHAGGGEPGGAGGEDRARLRGSRPHARAGPSPPAAARRAGPPGPPDPGHRTHALPGGVRATHGMELMLGSVPVTGLAFGPTAAWAGGRLTIDPDRVRALVGEDPRIRDVSVDLVEPGEATRIIQMRDVIEPRIKVRGRGHVYPGVAGHPADTVGDGETRRFAGLAVMICSEALPHVRRAVSAATDSLVDLSGPGAVTVYSTLRYLVLTLETDPGLELMEWNETLRGAGHRLADDLARHLVGLEPSERQR